MQEQNESKAPSLVARLGTKNLIWLGVFVVMMLAVATTWLWPHRTLPTSSWRDANSTLPWQNDGLKVKELTGYWKSSAGNERMMLRTAYYPVAEIELGECDGSGMLYISFTDSNDRQTGDAINLYYEKGNFRPRQEVNIMTEGNKARVFIEAGYDKRCDFELHQFDESTPLWRVQLACRPEGARDVQPLGSVTIPAELQ